LAIIRRCSEGEAVLHENTVLTVFRLVHFADDKFPYKFKDQKDLLASER